MAMPNNLVTLSYRRSTTVSLENYPLYSLKVFFMLHVAFGLGSGFSHILDPHIFLNTWNLTSLQLMLSLDTQRPFKHTFLGEEVA